jgi:hypothetical protein
MSSDLTLLYLDSLKGNRSREVLRHLLASLLVFSFSPSAAPALIRGAGAIGFDVPQPPAWCGKLRR